MENRSYKHWVVVAMMCCLAAGSIGICTNATGVFYTPVSESLGVLRGSFAMHATLQSLAMAVVTLYIPKIMDHMNYRKVLLAGVILSVVTTALMGISSCLWMFYVLGIVRGIGTGVFAIVPLTMIISNWFDQKHGLATSIALSFSGLAGAVFSPLFSSLITSFGWQNAYFIQAVALFAVTFPALVVKWTVQPEESNLLPYGYEESSHQQIRINRSGFNFITVSFVCMCIFCILHTSITGISQHLSGFATSIGLTAGFGATLMSLTMIGNISTKLLIGIISDRFGPIRASVIMIVTNMISLVLMMAGMPGANTWILMTGSFVFGSIYAVGAVGLPLLTRYFFGQENYSIAYAKIGFLTSVGSSSSLTLIGYLYDFTGTYLYMLVIAMAFHVIDLCLLVIIRKKAGKEYNRG